MEKIKQINIKNRTYYFYNDRIDLKGFDAKLLKIDKKNYNEIDIYYICYVTIKKFIIVIITEKLLKLKQNTYVLKKNRIS